MTKFQQQVLERFAEYGAPASKREVAGLTPGPALDEAVHALIAADLLAVVEDTRDAHGGTRVRVTAAGYAALGRPVPKPAMKNVKASVAKSYTVLPSRN